MKNFLSSHVDWDPSPDFPELSESDIFWLGAGAGFAATFVVTPAIYWLTGLVGVFLAALVAVVAVLWHCGRILLR